MSRLRFDGRAVCDRPGSVRYSVAESSGYVCDRLGPIGCARGKARQHPALAGGGVGTVWVQHGYTVPGQVEHFLPPGKSQQ